MNDNRKQHGWAFWLVLALVALPVAYVLSLGPFEWAQEHGYVGNGGIVSEKAYVAYTAPARFAVLNGPRPFGLAMLWYADWWRRMP